MKAITATCLAALVMPSAAHAYDEAAVDRCTAVIQRYDMDRASGKNLIAGETGKVRECIRVMNAAFKEAGMKTFEFTTAGIRPVATSD